jgi:hypothetical protein
MITLAYCAESFKESVRKASGTDPITCPPIDQHSFLPTAFMEADFIYIKLHGLPDQPFWYGDNMITALSAYDLEGLELKDKVMYVANCWFANTPMMSAAKATKATVIGGAGLNFGGSSNLIGTDVLGLWLRLALQIGWSTSKALGFAKMMVKGHSKLALGKNKKALQDALEFKVL